MCSGCTKLFQYFSVYSHDITDEMYYKIIVQSNIENIVYFTKLYIFINFVDIVTSYRNKLFMMGKYVISFMNKSVINKNKKIIFLSS